jgi:hypothetical protein
VDAWVVTAAGVGAGTAVATLGPRLGYRALRKDPHVPIERFGFHVTDPASRRRVAGIVEAFFGGYNAALSGAGAETVRARCLALPEILHPFAFEGSGMGRGARALLDWRLRPGAFGAWTESVHGGWRFLYDIGLGIWTAFVGPWQTRRVARTLGASPLAGLLWDGVGFQCGFFHRVRDAAAHARLGHVPAAERPHALRGFGRSLWFVFRDDPAGLLQAIAALPAADRPAAVTGVGLAVAFTGIDDGAAVLATLAGMPPAWQRDLERGLRLALYVRHAGQPRALAAWNDAAPAPAAARLRAHLEHAVQAHDATWGRSDFLHAFTKAC